VKQEHPRSPPSLMFHQLPTTGLGVTVSIQDCVTFVHQLTVPTSHSVSAEVHLTPSLSHHRALKNPKANEVTFNVKLTSASWEGLLHGVSQKERLPLLSDDLVMTYLYIR
ncbi:Hypothetical predicted protein, partial [Marmota monax]